MLRFLGCVVVIGLAGCGTRPTPLDTGEACKNLKTQAAEVGQATLKEDHRKMADLTHPTVVEKMGGRDKFVQRLESIAVELKRDGFRFTNITFSDPSEVVESSGELFAVLPFKLDLTGPGGAPGTQPSYLIAWSNDGGRNWKFLDGAGVAGDRNRLKQIFPSFPDKLQLPAKQEPTWR